MENNETSEEKKISIKRIFIATTIIFLLITTLYFGYLYLTEDEDVENIDSIESVKTEEEVVEDEIEEEVVCDFDKIKEEAQDDNSRVRFVYTAILDPTPGPRSPYAPCKETLKTIIQNIIENEKNPEIPSDRLISEIGWGRIEYLIDDIFIVYSFGDIWSIDIINETVDLLWKTQGSGLAISQLYAISERNVSRLFFSTHPIGLGGSKEEEAIIHSIIKTMCDNGDLGTFMYDTSTEKVTQIAEAEECIEMGL
jgi:hypothetical protein